MLDCRRRALPGALYFWFMNPSIQYRLISAADNAVLAAVIRSTMEEWGVNFPGTVYYDESTDHLYDVFAAEPRSCYFIAELNGQIAGGAGIFPTPGLPSGTCELVKMYLSPDARGLGIGKALMARCIAAAKEKAYRQIYLESMPELSSAISLYKKSGFLPITAPLGQSGHWGCKVWMTKNIDTV